MLSAVPDLQMWVTLALVVVAIAVYAAERVPLELTSAMVLAFLLVFFHFVPVLDADGHNRLDAARLIQGFANPGLIAVLALLIVGQAMVRTGALDNLGTVLHQASGGNALLAITMVMVTVLAISAVLNNTPVVVIFIPIVAGLAERLGRSVSSILIPLSFTSILGGMTTLIGSSTNLLVNGVVIDMGLPRIGFFDFTFPGVALALIGLGYVLLVAPRLLPDRASLVGRITSGDGKQFIAQIEVPEGSPLVGEQAVAGRFSSLPDMTVRMIQRGEHAILPPFENVALKANDIVVVAATRRVLADALARYRGQLRPAVSIAADEGGGDSETPREKASRERTDQVLAEVLVAPASRMIGRDLAQIGFRYQYRCIVLGIQRRSRMIRSRITEIRLEAGDVLLIQGHPQDVEALRNNRDVVLMEWSQSPLPAFFHARRATVIFAAVVLLAATEIVPIVIAAIVGAVAMILGDCINLRQAARAVDSRLVMIVAATLALGASMQETGAATFLAMSLTDALRDFGPSVVLSAFFLLVALLTNVLSNNATAVLFTPVAIGVAAQLGVDPMVFVYSVIFAANCSYATPIGYQTNLLVMAPGHYRFMDFVRSGGPLLVLIWLSFSLFAPWYYGLR